MSAEVHWIPPDRGARLSCTSNSLAAVQHAAPSPLSGWLSLWRQRLADVVEQHLFHAEVQGDAVVI